MVRNNRNDDLVTPTHNWDTMSSFLSGGSKRSIDLCVDKTTTPISVSERNRNAIRNQDVISNFFDAACGGDLAMIQQCLRHGVNVNARLCIPSFALDQAAAGCRTAAVLYLLPPLYLLKANSDCDLSNKRGWAAMTPGLLNVDASRTSDAVIRTPLNAGADALLTGTQRSRLPTESAEYRGTLAGLVHNLCPCVYRRSQYPLRACHPQTRPNGTNSSSTSNNSNGNSSSSSSSSRGRSGGCCDGVGSQPSSSIGVGGGGDGGGDERKPTQTSDGACKTSNVPTKPLRRSQTTGNTNTEDGTSISASSNLSEGIEIKSPSRVAARRYKLALDTQQVPCKKDDLQQIASKYPSAGNVAVLRNVFEKFQQVVPQPPYKPKPVVTRKPNNIFSVSATTAPLPPQSPSSSVSLPSFFPDSLLTNAPSSSILPASQPPTSTSTVDPNGVSLPELRHLVVQNKADGTDQEKESRAQHFSSTRQELLTELDITSLSLQSELDKAKQQQIALLQAQFPKQMLLTILRKLSEKFEEKHENPKVADAMYAVTRAFNAVLGQELVDTGRFDAFFTHKQNPHWPLLMAFEDAILLKAERAPSTATTVEEVMAETERLCQAVQTAVAHFKALPEMERGKRNLHRRPKRKIDIAGSGHTESVSESQRAFEANVFRIQDRTILSHAMSPASRSTPAVTVTYPNGTDAFRLSESKTVAPLHTAASRLPQQSDHVVTATGPGMNGKHSLSSSSCIDVDESSDIFPVTSPNASFQVPVAPPVGFVSSAVMTEAYSPILSVDRDRSSCSVKGIRNGENPVPIDVMSPSSSVTCPSGDIFAFHQLSIPLQPQPVPPSSFMPFAMSILPAVLTSPSPPLPSLPPLTFGERELISRRSTTYTAYSTDEEDCEDQNSNPPLEVETFSISDTSPDRRQTPTHSDDEEDEKKTRVHHYFGMPANSVAIRELQSSVDAFDRVLLEAYPDTEPQAVSPEFAQVFCMRCHKRPKIVCVKTCGHTPLCMVCAQDMVESQQGECPQCHLHFLEEDIAWNFS